MSKKDGDNRGDVPGNAMASAAIVQKLLLRSAETLVRADATFERLFEENTDIQRLSITMPRMDKPGYMVYITAVIDGRRMVAFSGGATFAEAVITALERLQNGSLKWRDDKYGS